MIAVPAAIPATGIIGHSVVSDVAGGAGAGGPDGAGAGAGDVGDSSGGG